MMPSLAPKMSHAEIEEQVDAIKRVTEKLLESKEKAFRFLQEAGILKDQNPSGKENQTQNKK